MQTYYATSVERTAERLCQRMASIRPLGEAILHDLRSLMRDRIDLPAGRVFVKEGDRCPVLFILEAGWALRARTLPCGKRQIIDYCLPGDILCSDSVLFGASGFDLMARSPLRVIRLEAPGVVDLWRRHAGFAAAIAWTAAQEQSIMAERIVSLGRRDSFEKLAFVLCEMAVRLSVIDGMPRDRIETPINQEDFADILGISVIHVNRTFRKLAEEGVAEYAKTRIRVIDPERLALIAGFSRDYLHFGADASV